MSVDAGQDVELVDVGQDGASAVGQDGFGAVGDGDVRG